MADIQRICPKCRSLIDGACQKCTAKHRSLHDATRGNSTDRGYDGRWRRYRKMFLRAHPLCADPFGDHGERKVPATVVDHIVPHKGDRWRFADPSNHQPLCVHCHNRKTVLEDGGLGREPRISAGVSQ